MAGISLTDLVEIVDVADDDLLLVRQGLEDKKYRGAGIFGGKDGLKSLAAWTDALFDAGGITNNGLPDTAIAPQRLEALHAAFDVYGTVAELASGKFQVGKRVSVIDRNLGVFEVLASGIVNGKNKLNAGGSKVAVYLNTGVAKTSHLGISGEDKSGFQLFLDMAGNLVLDTNVTATEVLIKPNTSLEITGSFNSNKHGYHGIIADGVPNVRIYGSGKVVGPSVFPAKDVGSTVGGGEKRLTIDTFNTWPKYTGATDTGMGAFNGGFLGNGGCGILVRNGCSNIDINMDVSGFNYSGVCVGDPLKVGIAEVINRNVNIDGRYHNNYDSGVSYHAVDGITLCDSLISENNGHPDALLTDYEANPGYGCAGRLVGSSGIAAKDAYVGGHYINNVRKGIDAHSGTDIRVNAYSKGSFVSGAVFGGNSGARGKVIGQIIIDDSGLSTGAIADAKTAFSLSGEYSSVDLKIQARNSGRAYGFYVGENLKRIKLDVDMESSVSARPFYTQGTVGKEVDITLSGVIRGAYTSPALATYCLGLITGLDMSGCTFSTGDQSLSMTNCNLNLGQGNRWHRPQFNTGNVGDFRQAKTRFTLEWNGTATPTVSFQTGAAIISNQGGSGSGWVVYAPTNSNNPAIADGKAEVNAQVTYATTRGTSLTYVGMFTGSVGTTQQVAISPRDAAGAVLPTNSSALTGVAVSCEINWGFQA